MQEITRTKSSNERLEHSAKKIQTSPSIGIIVDLHCSLRLFLPVTIHKHVASSLGLLSRCCTQIHEMICSPDARFELDHQCMQHYHRPIQLICVIYQINPNIIHTVSSYIYTVHSFMVAQ